MDLSCGVIGFDTTEDVSRLAFEKLPRNSVVSEGDGDAIVRATRCINVSDSYIVYAEVRHRELAVILVWSKIVGP